MTPAAKLAADGGTAFPWSVDFAGPSHDTMAGVDVPAGVINRYLYAGATLRDFFAAAALQGMLSNPKLHAEILKNGGASGGWIESSSYGWADAMLKERAK